MSRIKVPDEVVRELRPKQVGASREEEAGVKPDPRRPRVRLAAITVRQPSPAARDQPRGTPLDPFSLGRHLKGQRRPRPEPK